MPERVRLRISGRVQGVYYRGATTTEARRLGVSGWVRNLPDGDVEALLEGPPEAVRALVAWCRIGPPGAVVTDVEESREPAADPLHGFRIVY
jgi:acylphosphatase